MSTKKKNCEFHNKFGEPCSKKAVNGHRACIYHRHVERTQNRSFGQKTRMPPRTFLDKLLGR